jgi:hypothetical protein
MEGASVEQVFDTLSDAIVYAFRQAHTTLLSLDKICAIVQSPNLFLKARKEGLIPCSTIIRRRISSTLSSGQLFVRAGPPRTCLWGIRPNNPLFLSDGVITASVEHMLTSAGPMTLGQLVQATQLEGADVQLFERFMGEHTNEFTKNPDDTYWFAGQPLPIQKDFESIGHALAFALSRLPDGASVEELTWVLCLSTVNTVKTITRRNISRELSRRTDLFRHLSRARYALMENRQVEESQRSEIPKPVHFFPQVQPLHQQHLVPVQVPPPLVYPPFTLPAPDPPASRAIGSTGEEEFDPFSFFGHDFQFAFE